jgi:hypothetical protein
VAARSRLCSGAARSGLLPLGRGRADRRGNADRGGRRRGQHPARSAGSRDAQLRRQRRRAGVRVHDRGRRVRGLRHRLLPGRGGGRARGPGRGRVPAADGRAALHGAPGARDRRAHPQHDVYGVARRHRGCALPVHDVLRRTGDDGAGRLRLRLARGHGGRDDLRPLGDDDRAQPRVGLPVPRRLL